MIPSRVLYNNQIASTPLLQLAHNTVQPVAPPVISQGSQYTNRVSRPVRALLRLVQRRPQYCRHRHAKNSLQQHTSEAHIGTGVTLRFRHKRACSTRSGVSIDSQPVQARARVRGDASPHAAAPLWASHPRISHAQGQPNNATHQVKGSLSCNLGDMHNACRREAHSSHLLSNQRGAPLRSGTTSFLIVYC